MVGVEGKTALEQDPHSRFCSTFNTRTYLTPKPRLTVTGRPHTDADTHI